VKHKTANHCQSIIFISFFNNKLKALLIVKHKKILVLKIVQKGQHPKPENLAFLCGVI